ncbi:uncharacterized protein PV09_06991 [Verruconis gallopava]|uniref:Uncharacterized protein n=1 Tax=Verruconis gallopava TaxID=253628 RepID=A0A0D2A3Z6_9PEZI|nr:uncharacterized protein PV09_06991 [Verruconis gallopava]KIW01513.1 hypothetical protein PV09_06991 [Verruconis gallopava]
MDPSPVLHVATLVARQENLDEATTTVPLIGQPGYCGTGNEYDGRLGLRISAIFVIFVTSLWGAWFPIFTRRRSSGKIFDILFFAAKYFGSGVIIATAFIHLLASAVSALGDPCLTGPITEYSWAEGIALMTIFILFFAELMTMRYGNFGDGHDHGHSHGHSHNHEEAAIGTGIGVEGKDDEARVKKDPEASSAEDASRRHIHARGEDHLGHSREHRSNEDIGSDWQSHGLLPESYAAQMTALFILEFGVIFHSIFIGLTLAVSGAEFITLYIVLVFHQTFEGLGLGTRLAAAPWPESKKWTPYILGAAYALSTPIAIAIGLGVRMTYPPGGRTALITNGVFDSISAGILLYTGLVELMAHEFMFSPSMQKAKISTLLSAFVLMSLGAGLMALLGKWA